MLARATERNIKESEVTDITIPDDALEGDQEAVLVSWLHADGTPVKQGDVIAEFMVDKAQLELTAPASGRLRIIAAPESTLTRGQVIGQIE